MIKRFLKIFAAMLIIIIIFTGCGKITKEENNQGTTIQTEEKTIEEKNKQRKNNRRQRTKR